MKKMNDLLFFGCMCLCLCACTDRKAGPGNVIKLEASIADPDKELKASDYFNSIEYIPLETGDSSLVGNQPAVTICKGRAYVCSVKRPCLVFDLKTGRFLHAIGTIDKGPGGYRSSIGMWIQPETEVLYFPGWRNNYLKYASDGSFLGEQKIPEGMGDASTVTYIDGNYLVGYCQNMMQNAENRLICFDKNGEVKYTLPQFIHFDTLSLNQLKSISVNNNVDQLKNNFGFSRGSFLMLQGPHKARIVIKEQPVFWHYGGHTWFKESFCDTIFRLSTEGMIADRIFDMGKYCLQTESSGDLIARKTQATINQVNEDDRFLFFTYFLRPEEEYISYRGIYDKKTGESRISELKGGFTDDVNHFMTFHPWVQDEENIWVDIFQPMRIFEWFEEYPEKVTEMKPEIQALRNLKEDDNPVLVIMKTK